MDYLGITRAYYAQWLGIAPEGMERASAEFLHALRRNEVQKGYGWPDDLYIWVAGNRVIASYGDKAEGEICRLEQAICPGMAAEEIALAVQSVWRIAARRSVKFVYDSLPEIEGHSRKMVAEDYPLYEAFFTTCNPGCTDIGWLREYFDEMIASGLCFGEIVDGKLACMNDLPAMPFMEERVREIGINTLPAHRGKGLARRVCLSAIREMIEKGICPQWSAANTNEASARLAHSLGFRKMADVLTITL